MSQKHSKTDESHIHGPSCNHPDTSKQDMIQKSMKNAGFLMIVQIFSKIMTFSLNFFVARIVSKEIYGYANIQMQLFNSLILWFSKEAVRKIVQRKINGLERFEQ